MKSALPLLVLVLAACGSEPANQNADANTRPDAVTAEAVSDTQAAEADALKAADAELDNLGNSIEDAEPDQPVRNAAKAK